MVYIQIDSENVVIYRHNFPFDYIKGLGKSEEELRKTGYLVDSIPEYIGDIPEGKMPELHFDGVEFSWKMVDAPPESPTYEELLSMYEAIEKGMTE